jgi:cytochrome c553
MPIARDLKHPYGYQWRTFHRPAALARAYWECVRCALPDRPRGLRSALDIAHLDEDPGNMAEDNLAALCRRCHAAHDYSSWAVRYRAWQEKQRAERIAALDAARPILQYLEGVA